MKSCAMDLVQFKRRVLNSRVAIGIYYCPHSYNCMDERFIEAIEAKFCYLSVYSFVYMCIQYKN